MTTAAVVAISPPSSPQRHASSSAASTMQGAASWSRSTRHTSAIIAQRQRNRSRRQANNISSHVLGFRRNHHHNQHHRTWRQAFLVPSRTSSSSSSSNDTHATTTTSSPSFSTSFFRLGRRTLTQSSSSSSLQTNNMSSSGCPNDKDANNTIDSLLHLLKAIRNHDPAVQQVVLEGVAVPWQYTVALLHAVADSPHVWRVQLRKVSSVQDSNRHIAAALQDVAERATALIDLDLSKNQLGYNCMQALQVAWQGRAEKINNNNNNKECGGSSCPLQRLNLEGNPLNVHALRVLSRAVTAGATPNLQILKLGRNPQCGVAGTTVLCHELLVASACDDRSCPVTWLDLRGNGLGHAGIWPLAQALTDPSCPLEYLSLQRNNLSNEGVAALAQAMQVNSRLQTLDLQRNPALTNEGAAALVQALWQNHAFTKLKIRHTAVNDMKIKNELLDLLVMNSYGPTLAASTKQSLQRLQMESSLSVVGTNCNNNNNNNNNTCTRPPRSEQESTPCVICFEANRTAGHAFGILLPCRHDNACWACCQRLRGHCHMCRSTIVKVVVAEAAARG